MNKPIREYKGGCFIENLMTEINMLMNTNKILTKENEQYEKVLHETQLALEGQRKVNVELSKKVSSLQQKLKKEEQRVEDRGSYIAMYSNLCDEWLKYCKKLKAEIKELKEPKVKDCNTCKYQYKSAYEEPCFSCGELKSHCLWEKKEEQAPFGYYHGEY